MIIEEKNILCAESQDSICIEHRMHASRKLSQFKELYKNFTYEHTMQKHFNNFS